jgi:mRNA interferase MazF
MSKGYIPDREDIVWLDFDPTKGKEIGKYRPALILSYQAYNKATGLVICAPVSTSIIGSNLEVRVTNLDKDSVVVSGIVQTMSWRDRIVKFITKAEQHLVDDVFSRFLPLIGADKYVTRSQ